jgi:hypothetical protein
VGPTTRLICFTEKKKPASLKLTTSSPQTSHYTQYDIPAPRFQMEYIYIFSIALTANLKSTILQNLWFGRWDTFRWDAVSIRHKPMANPMNRMLTESIIHYDAWNSQLQVPIRSQVNNVHIPIPSLRSIFYTILPPMPRAPKRSPPFMFSTFLTSTLHYPAHPPSTSSFWYIFKLLSLTLFLVQILPAVPYSQTLSIYIILLGIIY